MPVLREYFSWDPLPVQGWLCDLLFWDRVGRARPRRQAAATSVWALWKDDNKLCCHRQPPELWSFVLHTGLLLSPGKLQICGPSSGPSSYCWAPGISLYLHSTVLWTFCVDDSTLRRAWEQSLVTRDTAGCFACWLQEHRQEKHLLAVCSDAAWGSRLCGQQACDWNISPVPPVGLAAAVVSPSQPLTVQRPSPSGKSRSHYSLANTFLYHNSACTRLQGAP